LWSHERKGFSGNAKRLMVIETCLIERIQELLDVAREKIIRKDA
jgi:hypothetical protein